jgi:hypothetical protein
MSLKSSQRGLQLFFRLHFNKRSTQEVMALQSAKNPNFKSFETPNLGVLRQNDIWMQPPWLITENTIRRKVMASPKLRPWVSLVNLCAPVVSLCTKSAPTTH